MPTYLAQGTKEYLPVDIVDYTGAVTDLSVATAVQFDVIDDAAANKYSNQAAVALGMRISSLVDTNSGGLWAVGHYRLFVEYTIGSEAVRLGPFDFYVRLVN